MRIGVVMRGPEAPAVSVLVPAPHPGREAPGRQRAEAGTRGTLPRTEYSAGQDGVGAVPGQQRSGDRSPTVKATGNHWRSLMTPPAFTATAC